MVVAHDTSLIRCANPKCRRTFIQKAPNQTRCPQCQLARNNKAKRRRLYDPSPDASSECWGCDFLNDCRWNVRNGKSPYCWAENPRHYLFIEKYINHGNNAARTLIAQNLERLSEKVMA